jgi:small-conductance mechanosensitive channel
MRIRRRAAEFDLSAERKTLEDVARPLTAVRRVWRRRYPQRRDDRMTYTMLSDRTDKLLWVGAIVVALLVVRALSSTIMRLKRRRAVGERQLVRLERGETAAALVATAIPYIAAIALIILLASAFLPCTVAALGASALVLILVGFGAQRFLTDVIAGGPIAARTGKVSVSTPGST